MEAKAGEVGEGAGREARVLSVQSHVVYGYVGNKAAIFPLQLLGFEADFINTVQFSNHTAYPSWEGERLSADCVDKLCAGLQRNGLFSHSHLLTGYIGNPAVLRAVGRLHSAMKKANPGLIYLCDPVLGDNGKLYVPSELVEIYRDEIVPVADFLTPNQFECEQLTGIEIRNERGALAAVNHLHERGVARVVITSLFYEGPQWINLLASEQIAGKTRQYRMRIPALSRYFTGTGDLLSALLLAWSTIHSDNFALACEKAVGGIQAVLRATAEHYKEGAGPSGMVRAELRLVQCKRQLEDPPILYRAEELSVA